MPAPGQQISLMSFEGDSRQDAADLSFQEGTEHPCRSRSTSDERHFGFVTSKRPATFNFQRCWPSLQAAILSERAVSFAFSFSCARDSQSLALITRW